MDRPLPSLEQLPAVWHRRMRKSTCPPEVSGQPHRSCPGGMIKRTEPC